MLAQKLSLYLRPLTYASPLSVSFSTAHEVKDGELERSWPNISAIHHSKLPGLELDVLKLN